MTGFYPYNDPDLPLDVLPTGNDEDITPETSYKLGCIAVLALFVGMLLVCIMLCCWALGND